MIPVDRISRASEKVRRRDLLKSLAAAGGATMLASLGCSRPARDGVCPEVSGKQIRWLVPFAPGGGLDIYSRLIEPLLERKLSAEIVIENMPGGGGTVSANTLRNSPPDGLTLGALNAPGLLVGALTGEPGVPNPARDLTILARIARNEIVWVSASRSPFHTMTDVFDRAAEEPILFGVSEVGSTNFVVAAITSNILGIEEEYISGHPGSGANALGMLRGETDILSATFESVLDQIDAGELRPVLQVGDERISPHPSLDGVPLLGGEHGLAAARARELSRDVGQAVEDARVLAAVAGAGMLVGGPPRMDERLRGCLSRALYDVMTDSEFGSGAARARRSLHVAGAEEAHAEIEKASVDAGRFIPLIRAAIDRMRR